MNVASSSVVESDAERALRELIPLAAEFQQRLIKAIQGKESGSVLLRVSYDVGRVTIMEWDAKDGRKVQVIGQRSKQP